MVHYVIAISVTRPKQINAIIASPILGHRRIARRKWVQSRRVLFLLEIRFYAKTLSNSPN